MIILILFQEPTWARRTFLESIRLDRPFILKVEVLGLIAGLAHEEESFLSLGETHSELTSVSDIHSELATTYLEAVSHYQDRKGVYCSEDIQSAVPTSFREEILPLTDRFEILGADWNFASCQRRRRHTLFYSGIFHQFRFSEDTRLRAIIDDQVDAKNKLFFAQIELPFLERMASAEILSLGLTDTSRFRRRARDIHLKVDFIRGRMERILEGKEGFYSDKRGIFISRDNIMSPERNDIPDEAFFLVTEFETRDARHSFRILREMADLEDSVLQNILNSLAKDNRSVRVLSKMVNLSCSNEPLKSYGGYRVNLDRTVEIIDIDYRGDDVSVRIVFDPCREYLQCYRRDTAVEERPVSCHSSSLTD